MEFFPSLSQAKSYEKQNEYKKIPLSATVHGEFQAEKICEILKTISHNVFILESCEDSKHWGRYSFLGYDTAEELTCKDGIVSHKQGEETKILQKTPHEAIRTILNDNKSPVFSELPHFTGGLVGYFSYEFLKYQEPSLDLPSAHDNGFQDLDLMVFDKIIVLDHLEEKMILITNIPLSSVETQYNEGKKSLENVFQLLKNNTPEKVPDGKLLEELSPAFSQEKFTSMIEKAKNYIFEGDIFQVVLSNPLSAKYEGSIFNTYRNLKRINPSPYMFYFSSPYVELAGASPETLVKLEEGKVTTFPLAGTKPRGKTPEEDIQLEKDLLSDEKECAEHNMLVDLGRNDIGKISKFGSVKVDDYMQILRFSHVMHIGSTVSGEIREEYDALDAINAVLPAGTLSGAPKIRACEIIHELEGEKRGIYGGAVGYLDFCGNMDTCIAIRLVFLKDGKVFVRSGAGIVADSVPEKEYTECINKAKAVVAALESEA